VGRLMLIKIAVRNLTRYRRRTMLTASLVAIGVVAVVVFGAASGGFKDLMIGQMTDSVLGHLQVHRKGYVASIDNLPLTLTLSARQVERVERVLRATPEVEAFSPRLKFGGLFSNYVETTSIRLNGVYPEQEFATVPLLPGRITQGERTIGKGQILIPELLASGLKVGIGDTIVVIVTNRQGSVNAAQLRVSGILASASGPGGRDGYMHIEDAASLLRMEENEVSEVAVRVRNFDHLQAVNRQLQQALGVQSPSAGARPPGKNGAGSGQGMGFEVHTWEALSPFANIAMMIDLLTLSVKLGLVAIVMISVMNVMLMSVYERVREIGTIAAMGTLPGKILSLFVIEGFSLGLGGALIGDLVGIVAILALRLAQVRFNFGQQTGLLLTPAMHFRDILAVSGIVVLVAVLGSVQPAFRASRMEPVEALRHG
jgi:putative ABC transport system permease protein